MFAPTDRDTAGLRHTQESAHAQLSSGNGCGLDYGNNIRLKVVQVYIYYQIFVLYDVLKDKYRNDYFDKVSKWTLFPSF